MHSVPAYKAASELPGLGKYKNYDDALLHHAIDLISQADIILAHCKEESTKDQVRADRDMV